MAKPDLGSKHKCQNCGTKFFDLNKDPIICPKCGSVFQATPLSTRAAARNTSTDEDDADAEGTPEVVSLDEADEAEDGKVAAAVSDDDVDIEDDDAASTEDDTFLEEEEEDSGDVSGLINGDIENDEER